MQQQENIKETDRYTGAPKAGALEKAAKAFSGIFSPLLVPTYVFAIALWITPLAASTERMRFAASFIVFIITAAIPMFTIIFLMRSGTVSDPSISNRRERLVPYIVTTLCYFAAGVYVHHLCTIPNHPSFFPWLYGFFFAAAVTSAVSCVINHFWKISAHMTSLGGLCAFLYYLAVNHLAIVPIMPWLTVFILFSGAVGASRLVLNRHTQMQLLCGFVLGFATITVIL